LGPDPTLQTVFEVAAHFVKGAAAALAIVVTVKGFATVAIVAAVERKHEAFGLAEAQQTVAASHVGHTVAHAAATAALVATRL